MAYGLSYHQISGPDWIVNAASTDRYDVTASAGGPSSKQDLKQMLRTLLVDRFHLAVHHESRMVPMYALIVAKNGPTVSLRKAMGLCESGSRRRQWILVQELDDDGLREQPFHDAGSGTAGS
jgi:uncharacterized protein (TIGR03435 family)